MGTRHGLHLDKASDKERKTNPTPNRKMSKLQAAGGEPAEQEGPAAVRSLAHRMGEGQGEVSTLIRSLPDSLTPSLPAVGMRAWLRVHASGPRNTAQSRRGRRTGRSG